MRLREQLKQHFNEHQINIAHLAQQCGIERTTIQHIIGNRKDYKLPGHETLERILDHLRLTPGERKMLEELYFIEKIGVYNFMNRKHVRDIVEQINSLQSLSNPKHRSIANSNQDLDLAGSIFSGVYPVNSILYSVCTEEVEQSQPRICLNIPLQYAYAKQLLLQLYWELEGQLEISHMIMFTKDAKAVPDHNANLKVLSEILPFALNFGHNYHANYYYSHLDPESELLLSMPYYLLTRKRLLLLSWDHTTAVLINDQRIIDQYRRVFEDNFKKTTALIQYFNSPFEVINSFSGNITPDCRIYTFEAQPCLMRFLSEKVLRRRIRGDVPNIQQLAASYSAYVRSYAEINIGDYFSQEGLDAFADTGRLSIIPEGLIDPFSREERIDLLTTLHKSISAGGKTRLIDPSKLYISDRVSIGLSLSKNSSLQLYSNHSSSLNYCVIKEHSILEAFTDFFESLATSSIVVSAEETLAAIDKVVERCNTRG